MAAVLIADADRAFRDLYAWLLSSYGFEVDTAGDALECLGRLRRFVPDLLILERELAWGGGDGVLGVVRDDRRLLPARVVLTSAVASACELDALASPPAVRVLLKPFQLSALFAQTGIAEILAPDARRLDPGSPCARPWAADCQ